MAEGRNHSVFGVLGGMGPLASAEFVKTIYECSLAAREQDTPRVVLYSDPTFPDRTEECLGGGEERLLAQLVEGLEVLRRCGAARVVICCLTIHHLLPRLPREAREPVRSLLDVIFDEVAESRRPHLLLCTTGARKLRIFQRHERWPQTRELFVLPDEGDQDEIHRLIYRIKRNQDLRRESLLLESLAAKYGLDAFIAGCTEFHLLAKHLAARGPGLLRCIDPLTSVAHELATHTHESRTHTGVV